MNSRKPPATEVELMHTLIELFNEVEPESEEEVDEVIREAGFDPKDVGTRIKKAANLALANSPLNWRNRGQEIAKERSRLAAAKPERPASRAGLLAAIQEKLTQFGGNQPALMTAYRNLDEATETDLASLLDQLDYLIGQQGTSKTNDQQ